MALSSTLRAGLTIDAQSAQRMLDQLVKNAGNQKASTSLIQEFASAWESELFETHGTGGAGLAEWAPLTPAYAAKKGDKPILVHSGSLMEALLREPATSGWTVKVNGPEYATYLARGRGPGGRGGYMPRRNPSPKPPRKLITQLVEKMLNQMMEDA